MDKALEDCIHSLKVVCILGGEVVPVSDDRGEVLRFRSIKGSEENKFGAIPAFERVLAGAALWRANPNVVLIPSGGKSATGVSNKEAPQVADIMMSELIEEGVPKNNIITEPESSVTADNLLFCAKIIKKMDFKPEEIGIITNYWHFGRVSTTLLLLKKEDVYPLAIGVTKLLSAERILMNEDTDKWGPYFMNLENTEGMRKTLEAEAKGNGQMLAGHQPKWPNPFRGFGDPLVTNN